MSEAVAAAPRIVGKKALCEDVLRWSRMRLDRRLEADPEFPVVTRGTQAGGWAFDADAVLAYLGASVNEPEADDAEPAPVRVQHQAEETARSRLNAAQAQLAEDKLRERRGELVEVGAAADGSGRHGDEGFDRPQRAAGRPGPPPEPAGDGDAEIIRQEVDGIRRSLVVGLREQLADG
jgi:hypothetical protein